MFVPFEEAKEEEVQISMPLSEIGRKARKCRIWSCFHCSYGRAQKVEVIADRHAAHSPDINGSFVQVDEAGSSLPRLSVFTDAASVAPTCETTAKA